MQQDHIDLYDIQQVGYEGSMARTGRPIADTSQITVRVPNSVLKRATAIVQLLTGKGYSSGRASVFRAAILHGLDVLEAEHGIVVKQKPKRPKG
jgi:hypothetical protein